MNSTLRTFKIRVLGASAGLLVAGASIAGGGTDPSADYANTHGGRSAVYQDIDESSLEQVTTPDRILAVTQGNTAPTAIWAALEHGEKVECMACIGSVAKLLYDSNAKTREISAWWLRRRIFGVFGVGEVYSQVMATLTTSPSDTARAYAAEALGEFLSESGIAPVAHAAVADASPLVRLYAVHALERLNNQGPNGEIATALSDPDEAVRLAALRAGANVTVFTGIDQVVLRLSDDSADVRRNAAEVLGTLGSADAVVSLIALTDPTKETDPRVRLSAVSALGKIGDPSAHDAVSAALSDSDSMVRSMAKMASRRL